ncbi:MAG: MATE family efflux transporter [Bacteroidetes bacterium]|nr:MATE family efflux transporter [Bacteroidota bacterium]
MPTPDHITDGPIARTVFSLAVPVVLGMLMEFALATTDYFWVGKLGASAQDAVTTSMVVIWTMFAATSIISIGITALVSRHIGGKRPERAAFYTRQGLAMALFVGLAASATGFALAPSFLRFMGTSEVTLPIALAYMRVSFGFATAFFIVEVVYAVFRATGDTRTPTKIAVTVVLLNMGIDPLLIFGWGPVPALGVAGASVATGLSGLTAASWALGKLLRGRAGFPVSGLFQYRPDFREIYKIARIGLPIASQQFVFVAVYWFLIKIVHQFGEGAAAAMGIGNRMESFSYLTCTGFAVAASTMVGQNLGAEKPDRAARCAWSATGLAVVVTMSMSVLFLTIPRQIASVFTDSPAVLEIAVAYLMILGLSQITMAVEIVLEGAFGGAGDTIPPMVVMSIGALARIPLAYWLCFTLGWGINGVWWTLTFTTTVKALILAYWFWRGRWKLKQV